MFKISARPSDM